MASQSEVVGPLETIPAGTQVTPEIFLTTVDTEDGVLRVVVMVPGIYENGGLCTVSVKGVSSTVHEEGPSEADVSSTACGQFVFSLSQLGSGKASITAGYKSENHAGTSETVEVEIP